MRGSVPETSAQNVVESEIRRLRRQSNAAIARHDADGAVEMMCEDVKIIASNGAIIDGAAAMAEVFREIFTDIEFVTFVREPEKIQLGDAVAAEEGMWTGKWNHRVVRGVYLARWHYDDNRWRIAGEFFVPFVRYRNF